MTNSTVRSDEGGFVLTWFAILLLVLMAMAGFSVDVWNWWLHGPAAPEGRRRGRARWRASTCRATPARPRRRRTDGAVAQNGYTIVVTLRRRGSRPPEPASRCTVDDTVANIFTPLLGIRATTDSS